MSVAWFAAFSHDAALSDADTAWPDPALAATPAVSRGLIETPVGTHDPYPDDGRPSARMRRFCFDDAARLSAAQRHPQILATSDALPALRDAAAPQPGG
jgi:hypothetical protein